MEFRKIVFLDSSQRADWQTQEQVIDTCRPSVCEVYGFVLSENENEVVVSAGRSSDNWFTLSFVVPVPAITYQEVLFVD